MVKATRLKRGTLVYKPYVLLTGASGTGKTDAVGSLLAAGRRVGVIDLEARLESIQQYQPLVFPVRERSEIAEVLRLLSTPDKRREYVKQATDGEWDDLDVLAFDSLLEYEWLLDQDLRVEHASDANRYKRWDEYGQRILYLCRALRQLATGNGEDSVGVLVTLGTIPRVSPTGMQYEELPLKGRVAPDRLYFQFGVVLRLHAVVEGEQTHWLLHSTKGEGWYAKSPPVLPAVVDITRGVSDVGFADVWDKLEAFYAGRGAGEEDK